MAPALGRVERGQHPLVAADGAPSWMVAVSMQRISTAVPASASYSPLGDRLFEGAGGRGGPAGAHGADTDHPVVGTAAGLEADLEEVGGEAGRPPRRPIR